MIVLALVLGCTGISTPTSTGDTGTTAAPDCDTIRVDWQATYDALVANDSCSAPEDCHAPFGACVTGLGGCQEPVSTAVTQADIDDLSAAFGAEMEASGCDASSAACDCYGGYAADCEGGHCVLTGPYYY
jgi:hypothetical protein